MSKNNYSEHMSYEFLKNLKATHPAWKLLTAKYAPLAISFFYSIFLEDNKREIPEYVLLGRLSNYLDELSFSDDEFTSPNDLLTQWADENHGWLRKYYPNNSDDIHYDLTSAAQKAIEWILSLKTESFVGTESRLIMVFRMLHEIVEKSESNPELRIKELERKKAEIEDEIALAQSGIFKTLDSVQIKERFVQAMQMSREILSDFRLVEQNFRELNREMRENIASRDKGKSELLADFFYSHNAIYQSEQGKSFKAFFDFLMSETAQDDFNDTIEQICSLDVIKEVSSHETSRRIVHDWISGGIHVQRTFAAISEQLRKYVDENFLKEERKINEVITNIEATAISIRNENKPIGSFIEMYRLNPEISLPFDRPLFATPIKNKFDEIPELLYGDKTQGDLSQLYSHIAVDKSSLKSKIDFLLESQQTVTLASVVEQFPLTQGLAELITYISVAKERSETMIEDGFTEPIFWVDVNGKNHRADFERIIYSRTEVNDDA